MDKYHLRPRAVSAPGSRSKLLWRTNQASTARVHSTAQLARPAPLMPWVHGGTDSGREKSGVSLRAQLAKKEKTLKSRHPSSVLIQLESSLASGPPCTSSRTPLASQVRQ